MSGWAGNERGGLAGSVFIPSCSPTYCGHTRERRVQCSNPAHPHIVVTRVSVVFSVQILLTHILLSHVCVSEQCSVL